jgi:hypothetical protein
MTSLLTDEKAALHANAIVAAIEQAALGAEAIVAAILANAVMASNKQKQTLETAIKLYSETRQALNKRGDVDTSPTPNAVRDVGPPAATKASQARQRPRGDVTKRRSHR